MDQQQILDELLALLEDNGVELRSEPMGGSGGGLCTIKGKKIFFTDTQATAAEGVHLCALAVAKIIDVDKIYIKPEVRQFIENITGADEKP